MPISSFFTKKSKGGASEDHDSTMIMMKAGDAAATAAAVSAKPILVILPGASGGLTRDFVDLLIPRLHGSFDVRLRPEEKWKGWNPSTNAQTVVERLCPREDDAAPWFVLGCSFGNRVAVSIVADALTPVAPRLILTGYPMYGPNGKEDRVQHIQKLPESADVLMISGASDEFITKNVPAGTATGEALLKKVVDALLCKASTTIHVFPKGGHGVYPSAKGGKGAATESIMKWVREFA